MATVRSSRYRGASSQDEIGRSREQAVEIVERREALKADLANAKKASDDFTGDIEAIDEEKRRLLSEAKFPIEGLGFGAGCVTYQDLPLDQASAAEQLRVSMLRWSTKPARWAL